jgi:Holliday junction resolvase RusA-like endonuclease
VIAFVVSGDPVGINATHVGGPRPFVKSHEARAFAQRIAGAGCIARGSAPTIRGPVRVDIDVYFRDERPDTDGPVKAILDALQRPNPRTRRIGAGIIANDRQVVEYVVRRHGDRLEPRDEVTVRELVPVAVAVDETEARRRKDLLAIVSPKRRAEVLTKRAVPSVRSFR